MARHYQVVGDSANIETWLKARSSMITASDIGALMGKSPFKSREELIHEKVTGESEDLSANRYVWWGIEMEAPNLVAFRKLTSCPMKPIGKLLQSRHTPLLGATLDGLIRPSAAMDLSPLSWATSGDWDRKFSVDLETHVGQTGVLELKNVSQFSVKKWNEAPEAYAWQVQAQMYVAGLTYAVLCAKVGSADMRAHVIRRDEFMVQTLLAEVERTWKKEIAPCRLNHD